MSRIPDALVKDESLPSTPIGFFERMKKQRSLVSMGEFPPEQSPTAMVSKTLVDDGNNSSVGGNTTQDQRLKTTPIYQPIDAPSTTTTTTTTVQPQQQQSNNYNNNNNEDEVVIWRPKNTNRLTAKRQAWDDYAFLYNREEVRAWLEECLAQSFDEEDLFLALMDGIWLCKLANIIKPGIIRRIHRKNSPPYMKLENINFFLCACLELGVLPDHLFLPTDLYEKKNLKKVIYCLLALSIEGGKRGLKHKLNITVFNDNKMISPSLSSPSSSVQYATIEDIPLPPTLTRRKKKKPTLERADSSTQVINSTPIETQVVEAAVVVVEVEEPVAVVVVEKEVPKETETTIVGKSETSQGEVKPVTRGTSISSFLKSKKEFDEKTNGSVKKPSVPVVTAAVEKPKEYVPEEIVDEDDEEDEEEEEEIESSMSGSQILSIMNQIVDYDDDSEIISTDDETDLFLKDLVFDDDEDSNSGVESSGDLLSAPSTPSQEQSEEHVVNLQDKFTSLLSSETVTVQTSAIDSESKNVAIGAATMTNNLVTSETIQAQQLASSQVTESIVISTITIETDGLVTETSDTSVEINNTLSKTDVDSINVLTETTSTEVGTKDNQDQEIDTNSHRLQEAITTTAEEENNDTTPTRPTDTTSSVETVTVVTTIIETLEEIEYTTVVTNGKTNSNTTENYAKVDSSDLSGQNSQFSEQQQSDQHLLASTPETEGSSNINNKSNEEEEQSSSLTPNCDPVSISATVTTSSGTTESIKTTTSTMTLETTRVTDVQQLQQESQEESESLDNLQSYGVSRVKTTDSNGSKDITSTSTTTTTTTIIVDTTTEDHSTRNTHDSSISKSSSSGLATVVKSTKTSQLLSSDGQDLCNSLRDHNGSTIIDNSTDSISSTSTESVDSVVSLSEATTYSEIESTSTTTTPCSTPTQDTVDHQDNTTTTTDTETNLAVDTTNSVIKKVTSTPSSSPASSSPKPNTPTKGFLKKPMPSVSLLKKPAESSPKSSPTTKTIQPSRIPSATKIPSKPQAVTPVVKSASEEVTTIIVETVVVETVIEEEIIIVEPPKPATPSPRPVPTIITSPPSPLSDGDDDLDQFDNLDVDIDLGADSRPLTPTREKKDYSFHRKYHTVSSHPPYKAVATDQTDRIFAEFLNNTMKKVLPPSIVIPNHVQRLSANKYKWGDTIVNMRCVNNMIVVRVGGGWMTLKDFLIRYNSVIMAADIDKISEIEDGSNEMTRMSIQKTGARENGQITRSQSQQSARPKPVITATKTILRAGTPAPFSGSSGSAPTYRTGSSPVSSPTFRSGTPAPRVSPLRAGTPLPFSNSSSGGGQQPPVIGGQNIDYKLGTHRTMVASGTLRPVTSSPTKTPTSKLPSSGGTSKPSTPTTSSSSSTSKPTTPTTTPLRTTSSLSNRMSTKPSPPTTPKPYTISSPSPLPSVGVKKTLSTPSSSSPSTTSKPSTPTTSTTAAAPPKSKSLFGMAKSALSSKDKEKK
eukprot:gene7441-8706_t